MNTKIKKDRIEQLIPSDVGIDRTSTSWLFRVVKPVSQVVSTTPIELTINTLIGSGGTVSNEAFAPVTLVATNPPGVSSRFVFSTTTTNYYSLRVILRASGTISGGAGITSYFLLELRRGDGTTVIATKVFAYVGKASGTTFTNEELFLFDSDLFSGGADPYQGTAASPAANGLRLYITKLSGNDMSLTNLDLRIKK